MMGWLFGIQNMSCQHPNFNRSFIFYGTIISARRFTLVVVILAGILVPFIRPTYHRLRNWRLSRFDWRQKYNRRQHQLVWLCLDSMQGDIKRIESRLERIDPSPRGDS